MTGGQRLFTLGIIVFVLAAAGTWLFRTDLVNASRHKHLSTTPQCLDKKNAFCTGIALKYVHTKELSRFTETTGIFPAIVEYYQAFGTSFSAVNARLIAEVRARPLIQLDPVGVSMADIVAGKYDSYLRTYAAALKTFGHPVMISFGHEMNGNWYSWSLPYTSPQEFVAAWRHIHRIINSAKVPRVVWTWDFNCCFGKNQIPKPYIISNPAAWYPGSDYVNWIGIDGYLEKPGSFDAMLGPSIALAHKLAPHKKVFIAETAVKPGPDQAEIISELFEQARKNHLLAVVWFDVNKRKQWRLEGNPVAVRAFHDAAEKG